METVARKISSVTMDRCEMCEADICKHWLGIRVENMPKTMPLRRRRQHGTSYVKWGTAPMGLGYEIHVCSLTDSGR